MLASKEIAKKPIPVRYLCPITRQIMLDPVIAADGRNYEREAIEAWLEDHNTSPLSKEPLSHKLLIPNFDKRSDIQKYLDKHPELYTGEDIYLPKASITALIAAIKAKDLSAVETCLAKDKCLLSIKLENDYTAWHFACQYGSPAIVNLLLNKLTVVQLQVITKDKPADFSSIYAETLLEEFLQQQNTSQADLLFSLGVSLEQPERVTNNSLLQRCIMQNNQAAVEWLLDKKIVLEHENKDGNTPLLLAILNNHTNIVELLLEHKANVKHHNHAKFKAVGLAALNNSSYILQLLLEQEKTLNNDFQTPLELARQSGKAETARLIIQTVRDIKLANLDEVAALRQEIQQLKQEKNDGSVLPFVLVRGSWHGPGPMIQFAHGGMEPYLAREWAVDHSSLTAYLKRQTQLRSQLMSKFSEQNHRPRPGLTIR